MRIRRSPTPSASPSSSSSSSSPPFPYASFSCFSSTHSTITTHSLTSSAHSTSPTRCDGLDLLVKAVRCVVAGSVVGVPYFQRRVITRRKRAIRFSNFVFRELIQAERAEEGEVGLVGDAEIEENSYGKSQRSRRKARTAMPSKYQDVFLHQWRLPRSRQPRSGKVRAGS